MEKKFARYDIASGYMVLLRNGSYRFVCLAGKGTLIMVNPKNHAWDYLSKWDTDTLKYHSVDKRGIPVHEHEYDIMIVYGLINHSDIYGYAMDSGDRGVNHRDIKWRRLPVKKMTVTEIEKELGYGVEIVSEKGE